MDEIIDVVDSDINSKKSNSYQVLMTDIKYNKNTIKSYKSKKDNEELPSQFTLDIPQSILNQANKKGNVFNDVIESFVYNFLTRKFGHEVYHCQIWHPFDDGNSGSFDIQ